MRVANKNHFAAIFLVGVAALTLATSLLSFLPQTALAATGINKQINFQGKLVNSNGTNVPNGTYNIEFKLYDAASSGTLLWTEDRVYATGTPDNRVTVTNGIFQVNLGSVCTLAGGTCGNTSNAVNFNTDNLYLGINLGNTSTAATFGAASGDGEMSPRVQFTAAPYALNSDKLQGIDATGFVQLGQGSTQSVNTSTTAVYLNQQGAGDILRLQANGTDAVNISNSGNILFGNNADKTISVTTSAAATAGRSVTVTAGTGGSGTGSTGGSISLQGGTGGGTNGSGGSITIDAGAKTGSGTAGTVTIGNGNASAVTIGRLGITTADPGALTVAENLTVGSTVLFVDSTAQKVGIGTTSLSGAGKLVVTGAALTTLQGTIANITGTIAVGANDNQNALLVNPTITATSSTGFNPLGIVSIPTTASGNFNSGTAGLVGIGSSPTFTGTGTMSELVAYAAQGAITTTGTVSANIGYYVKNPQSAGTINYNYGINVDPLTAGTGNYGVYVAGSGGTNTGPTQYGNYSFYAETGQSYFGGDVTTTGNNLTKSAANSPIAFQIQNSTGASLLDVSTVMTANNLVANPSFETNINGWTAKGSATLALNATAGNAQYGNNTMTATTTASGDGAQYAYSFLPSTTYSASIWAKSAASTSTVIIGRQENGSNVETGCSSATLAVGAWTQYICTFTTGATINNSSNLYLRQTVAGARTIHIDGVSLVAGSTVVTYRSPASQLQVDPSGGGNVSLLGTNNGETGPWQRNTSQLPGSRYQFGTATANGYIYVVGGNDGSASQTNTIYYAKVASDGTTGTWQTNAVNLPQVLSNDPIVVTNGYLYVLGGYNSSAVSTVYYAKINADGSVGAFTTNAFALGCATAGCGSPAPRAASTAATANGYIYVMGGFDGAGSMTNTTWYAKLAGDGSIGAWATTNTSGTVGAATVAIANGYIYQIGGGNGSGTSQTTILGAVLNSNGTTGTWSTMGTLPSARQAHSSGVSNGYLYVVAGDLVSPTSTVYYGKINADGTITGITASATNLPAAREKANGLVVNGYLYNIGGKDSGGNVLATSYYARVGGTVQVNGNLDLLGGQGSNLSDPGDQSFGSVGGSITAGNGTFVGALQALGQGSFAQSLAVGGNLNVQGSAALGGIIINGSTLNTTLPVLNDTDGGLLGGTPNSPLSAAASVDSYSSFAIAQSTGSMTITLQSPTNAAAGRIVYVTNTGSSSFTMYGSVVPIGGAQTIIWNGTTWVASTTSSTTLQSAYDNSSSPANILTSSATKGVVLKAGVGFDNQSLLQVQNAAGSALVAVNTVAALSNLIGNSSFETNTSGWSAKGSAVVTNDTTASNAQYGLRTLKAVNTASGDGAQYTYQFAASTQYTLSMWAKTASGSTTAILGRQENGSNVETGCSASGVTTTWTQFTCTFTTGATINTAGNIYLRQTVAGTPTIFIDGVTLAAGATAASYTATASDLQVDASAGSSVTLLAAAGAEPGSWQRSPNNLSGVRMDAASVTANGYIYEIGGYDGSYNSLNTVYYAKANADGTTGAWVATSTLPAVRSDISAITANGYVYVFGGSTAWSITAQNSVYYAKINNDGTLGTWNSTTNLPASAANVAAVTANSYVYIFGANGTATYAAKLNIDGTIGAWVGTTVMPASIGQAQAVVANGYVYLLGGVVASTAVSTVYSAPLAANGALGSWTATPSLPSGLTCSQAIVSNGYVYMVGGNGATDCNTGSGATLYYARLNANGSTGAWVNATNQPPYIINRATSVVLNGNLYIIGGDDDASIGPVNTVLYARLGATVQLGGNLDLVGLQGSDLADAADGSNGSSVGGSITAGNGTFVGSLQVMGQSSVAQGLAVGGNLAIQGSASIAGLTVAPTSGSLDYTTVGADLHGANNFSTQYTSTGWTVNSPVTQATHTTGTTALVNTTVAITTGSVYQLAFVVSGSCGTAGNTLTVALGGTTAATLNSSNCSGTYRYNVTAGSTTKLTFTPTAGWLGTIASVSIKQITGTISPALTVRNNANVTVLEIRPSGDTSNVAIGLNAGLRNTTNGVNNTALGSNALVQNTDGTDNTAVGANALQYSNTGFYNTAVGSAALQYNLGTSNDAFGAYTLGMNTTGNNNSGFGDSVLTNSTTGSSNSAFGAAALFSNTIGGSNTAFGAGALQGNTTGSTNTSIGSNAGRAITTGSSNTFIGNNAGYTDSVGNLSTLPTISNSVAIGQGAQVLRSDAVVIGNSADISLTVGIGNPSPQNFFSAGPLVYYSGSGVTACQGSSGCTVSSTTVTASSTIFNNTMIGDQLLYADGTSVTITGFIGTTSVTVNTPLVRPSQSFQIFAPGLQVTNAGAVFTQGSNTSQLRVLNASSAAILNVDTTNNTTTLRSGNDTATLGGELYNVTNNYSTDFTNTNWTVSPTNQATHQTGNTSPLVNTSMTAPTSGVKYLVTFKLFSSNLSNCGTGSDSLTVTLGGATVANLNALTNCYGAYSFVVTTSSTTPKITFTPTSAWSGTISNLSIKLYTPTTINSVLTLQNNSGTNILEVRPSSSATNTFIGVGAGSGNATGTNNYALGYQALQSNTTGSDNQAIGYLALQSNLTGNTNVAIGSQALQSNTGGNDNVALGYQALTSNVSGMDNFAAGYTALGQNTTGQSNIAIGYQAAAVNKTGITNIALGFQALFGNTTGSGNIGIGSNADGSVSTGNNNIALGNGALNGNSIGNANLALGYNAGYFDGNWFGLTGAASVSNSTALGQQSLVLQNNSVSIGNDTDTALKVGIGNPAPMNFFGAGAFTGASGSGVSVSSGSTAVTGGSGWTSALVGLQMIFADGTYGIVAAVPTASTITLASGASATETSAAYRFYYQGLQVKNDGTVYMQGASTSQFGVKTATGASLLNADTTNARVTVGSQGVPTAQLFVGGSTPSTSLASVTTSTSPWGLYVMGDYAYTINNGTSFQIFNVSNPSSIPAAVSTTAVTGATSINGLYGQGHYVYLVDQTAAKLFIYDVANPASPSLVSTFALYQNSYGIAVSGRYAYITGALGVQVVDITNPALPASVGTTSIGASYGVIARDKYLYVTTGTASNNSVLKTIDVSNPSSPTVVSTSSQVNNLMVYVEGKYAYTTDGNVFRIFDISNPTSTPTQVGTYSLASSDYLTRGHWGMPYSIVVHDRLAYVAGANANVYVVDITNPASPSTLSSFSNGSSADNVFVLGNNLFTTDYTASTLKSYDLGGTYSQSIAVGTLKTGSETVDGNSSIGGTLNVGTGLNVVGSAAVNGDLGVGGKVLIQGSNAAQLTVKTATGSSLFNTDTLNSAVTVRGAGTNQFAIQNSGGANLLAANSSGVPVSLIANASFESGINGWTAKGSATVTADTTASNALYGSGTLKAVDTTTNDGVQTLYPFLPSTAYTVTLWAKTASGSTTAILGRQENGSNVETGCTAAGLTTTWTQYTCSFTTGATINGAANLYLRQTIVGTPTIFIDGVSLVTGGTAASYIAPATQLQVDASGAGTLSLLASNASGIGTWNSATNLSLGYAYGTSLIANGFAYNIGGYDDGTNTARTTVSYTKLNADGSTGAWTTTTALPLARKGAGVTTANGYVYVVGGESGTYPSGVASTTVYYAKQAADGTLGTWNTTTVLLSARTMTTAFVANGYIYNVGGMNSSFVAQNTAYYARLNADGSIGAWNSGNTLAAGRACAVTAVTGGYAYVFGGHSNNCDDNNMQSTVYYSKLNAVTGAPGAWTPTTSMTSNREQFGVVINNGYAYALSAVTATSTNVNSTEIAHINTDGTIGAWAAGPILPDTRIGYGYGVNNGYLYVFGGANAGYTVQTTVFYARLGSTLQVGGNVDLLGLSGQTSADGGDATSGSNGGSLTAANGSFVGALQVRGQASFGSGVGITGNLTAFGSATFANTTNTTTAFTVQDASSNNLFMIDSTNSRVQVGSTTLDGTGTILVLDTKNTAGEPTGVNGAIYYNTGGNGGANSGSTTFAGKFRCYEGSVWKNCIGMRDISERRWGYAFAAGVGSTALTPTGTLGALTQNGGAADTAFAEGFYVKYTTGAVSGNAAGVTAATTNSTSAQWKPKLFARVKVDSNITNSRYWVALTSTTLTGSDGTGVNMGVRYSTSAGDTNWMCVTGDGASTTAASTGVAVQASHYYDIIVDYTTTGSLVCSVSDGTSGSGFVSPAAKTSPIPTAATMLFPQVSVTTLTTTAHFLEAEYFYLEQN